MPTFQLLPGAMGFDTPDGRRLKADRRGRITVDESTAEMVRGSSAKRRYDAIVEVAPYRHITGDGRECDCGFAPWSWQRSCPRCGASLEPGE